MICLTFDTDHMKESRLSEFLDSVEIPGEATFFCTQVYDCLAKATHELGPHPFLGHGVNWSEALQEMRENFPKAVGWRSHTCIYSHELAIWLNEHGYTYASTDDDFGRTDITPVMSPWGVWQLPIYYMDNMDFSSSYFMRGIGREHKPFSERYLTGINETGLFVFDFHPIHLMLNSPNRDHYFSMRDRFIAGEPLADLQYKGYGSLRFYQDLCAHMKGLDMRSEGLSQSLPVMSSTKPLMGALAEPA